MKKRLIKISIALILIAAAFYAWQRHEKKSGGERFEAVTVEKGSIKITVQATGTTMPQNRLELKPPISGRIESIKVQEGEKVKKGEPILVDENGETIKAKNSGVVKIEDSPTGKKLFVIQEAENFQEYVVPAGIHLLIKDKDLAYKGQQLTEGNLNLHKLLALKGTAACQAYIISEVQKIYSSQGQHISDKHVEIIVRQMFSKLRVVESGTSELLIGDVVEKLRLDEINSRIEKSKGQKVVTEQLLLGITKASLNTESFLAAASFQETTRVLIDAAVTAKSDHLRGLKENVIIGKLIPAGTGFTKERVKDIMDGMK